MPQTMYAASAAVSIRPSRVSAETQGSKNKPHYHGTYLWTNGQFRNSILLPENILHGDVLFFRSVEITEPRVSVGLYLLQRPSSVAGTSLYMVPPIRVSRIMRSYLHDLMHISLVMR